MRALLLSALMMFAVAACGGEEAEAPELGQVQLAQDPGGVFEFIEDGDTVPVIYGYQGGYHLPAALAVEGARPGQVIEMWITAFDAEAPGADGVITRARFIRQIEEADLDEAGVAHLGGLFVLLEGPEVVADREVRLLAEVTDTRSVITTERVVRCVDGGAHE